MARVKRVQISPRARVSLTLSHPAHLLCVAPPAGSACTPRASARAASSSSPDSSSSDDEKSATTCHFLGVWRDAACGGGARGEALRDGVGEDDKEGFVCARRERGARRGWGGGEVLPEFVTQAQAAQVLRIKIYASNLKVYALNPRTQLTESLRSRWQLMGMRRKHRRPSLCRKTLTWSASFHVAQTCAQTKRGGTQRHAQGGEGGRGKEGEERGEKEWRRGGGRGGERCRYRRRRTNEEMDQAHIQTIMFTRGRTSALFAFERVCACFVMSFRV